MLGQVWRIRREEAKTSLDRKFHKVFDDEFANCQDAEKARVEAAA